MPVLTWIGKEKVMNHHMDVPFRVLEQLYTFNAADSENKIINGDNLEALKALLPQYEGKIKCIYIDPPYNTGNENWVYNDNVNHPKIKKWLGQVVGKESEDLTRHDKWLCMMYPRLKLLHRLLSDEGVIFISLDDNESTYMKLILDEIFGSLGFIQQIIWKNKYGPGAMTKGFGNVHEYIFCYSKKPISSIEANLSEEEKAKYKLKDNYFNIRGPYITQPLATKSKDDRPNLVYPIIHEGVEIWPDKQWIWAKERMQLAYEKGWLQINEREGKYSVRFKQYLKEESGEVRKGKPISIMTGPYNQDGTSEMVDIFGSKKFDNPKPSSLVEYLISMIINGREDKDGVYLDSFAGSGTTAHAVLNLNKQDGGNRKFILIEMEEYAETITAERVKRVINGYADKEGTGGSFNYYELGEALFIGENSEYINESVGIEKIRQYIWYSETRTAYAIPDDKNPNPFYLGQKDDTAYYFIYEKDTLTTLDYDMLSGITVKAGQYVLYADNCLLPRDLMLKNNIVFKKIPRDITRF